MTPMAAKRGRKFDLKTFLSTIDGGRKIVTVPRKQTLFSQGDSSAAVFYIQKRLARILLLLAQFGKDGKPETVIPKISQETLAEMVGTTRSRVSFFMNRFRKLGFVDYHAGDELQVHSSLLNIVLHD